MVVALKYYMWALIAIGSAGFIYRTILGAWVVPRLEYIVEEIKQVNSNIIEIIMRPKDGEHAFTYRPGQFIFIGFPDVNSLKEVHPFSLTSEPGSDRIAIGVKSLGDYTKRLNELKTGMRAVIEGPFGRTSYVYYPNKEQIWIAGGIGITPFLGMARSLKPEDGYKVDLYYSAATAEDAAFKEELKNIASRNPNFRLIDWYGMEKGFLNADAIIKESNGVASKEIFLCGPPPMMHALKNQFDKWKVPASHIHSEEFALN
jgi:predicted ferric reductase